MSAPFAARHRAVFPQPARAPLIGVLRGEGVGPEVVDAALEVLAALGDALPQPVRVVDGGDIGRPAEAPPGRALSPAVAAFCAEIFEAGGVLLCGPGGGRFVYELRRRFDLWCKLTPLQPAPALLDAGVVSAAARRGVDVLMVRENAGGLYFGDWGESAGGAWQACRYAEAEVRRILEVALDLAAGRRRRLTVTLKPGGVPAVSTLWERVLRALAQGSGVQCEVLDVDNAAYQLIARADEFDVVASPNLFGDILADSGALLLGSRGLSHSGNFGDGGRAVYQTGHGAARDLAGRDLANPGGQILSLAMLLRLSLGATRAAAAVETALDGAWRAGWRTADVAAAGSRVLGTRAFAARVAEAVRAELATGPV